MHCLPNVVQGGRSAHSTCSCHSRPATDDISRTPDDGLNALGHVSMCHTCSAGRASCRRWQGPCAIPVHTEEDRNHNPARLEVSCPSMHEDLYLARRWRLRS